MNNTDLIAPCGMNCAICLGYLRERNPCSGCRDTEGYKPNQCHSCIIINCEKLKETEKPLSSKGRKEAEKEKVKYNPIH